MRLVCIVPFAAICLATTAQADPATPPQGSPAQAPATPTNATTSPEQQREALNIAQSEAAKKQLEANAASQKAVDEAVAKQQAYQAEKARYDELRAQTDAAYAKWQADVAKWQADVAACTAGDIKRCQRN